MASRSCSIEEHNSTWEYRLPTFKGAVARYWRLESALESLAAVVSAVRKRECRGVRCMAPGGESAALVCDQETVRWNI